MIELPINCIPNNNDTALVYFDEQLNVTTLSYEKLWEAIERKAAFLSNKGKPGSIIGVSMPHPQDYVINMLAIWKAGMVYMPLEFATHDNEEKQKDILSRFEKSNGTYLISTESYHYTPRSLPHSNLAYIMCSSGTTGVPKIIGLGFEALMSRIRDHQTRMDINKANNSCMLGLLGYAWDASIMETLSALTAGIPLVLVPPHIRKSLSSLPTLFKKANEAKFTISTALFVPSILQNFSPTDFPGLKSFLATGEAFAKIKKVEDWFKAGVRMFNGWGSTEYTFGGSIIEMHEGQGFPIFMVDSSGIFNGLKPFLLSQKDPDAKWTLAGEQEEAEIFIAGNGIGQYINNNNKNHESFITRDRYSTYFDQSVINTCGLNQYEKMYRTRDVVKRENDKIVFCRRSDRIIKVSGKQVDLELIEEELRVTCHQAFVFFDEGLIKAFVYNKNNFIDTNNLVKGPHLYYQMTSGELFNEAKKQAFKVQDLMEKGKAERLITHEITPYNELEAQIAAIWMKSLDLPTDKFCFSTKSSFSKVYGGESLQSMNMISSIWEELVHDKEQESVIPAFQYHANKHDAIEEISLLINYCNQSFLNTSLEDIIQIKAGTPDHDAVIVSLVRDIQRSKLEMPYVILCKNGSKNPLYPLYQKLIQKLEGATLALNQDELEKAHARRKHQRLLLKLQKAQQAVFNTSIEPDVTLSISEPILFVLGDIVSGKTTRLIATAKALWKAYAETGEGLIPIYFSLRGMDHTAIEHWLRNNAHLTHEELILLKTYKILYLLDDYDLLARDDFPAIRHENNSQLMIGCRARHMLDTRCWRNFPNAQKIYLDKPVLPALEDLMAHEAERLGVSELSINEQDLNDHAEEVFSLKLQPSSWESSRQPRFYLHNISHFNFIRELLIKVYDDIYRVPKITLSHTTHEENKGSVKNLPENWKAMCNTLRESTQSKPIFAFSPITGDVPGYYTILSEFLGFHQAFYVFKLLEKEHRTDREGNLYTRTEDYASIIQHLYPNGKIILLGWSFGAIQAYATAKHLRKMGREIDIIINIDCAWPKDPESVDIQAQYDHLEPKLQELYKNKEKESRGYTDKILENVKFNLDANRDFLVHEKSKNEDLDVPVLVFKAEITDTGLTTVPEFEWPSQAGCEIDEIKASDHFTIFDKPEFKEKIKKRIHALQPYITSTPLEERLRHYCKRVLETITSPEHYQPLPIQKTRDAAFIENIESLFAKTNAVLTAAPGAGKTTTLLSLQRHLNEKFLDNKTNKIALYIPLNELLLKDLGPFLAEIGLTPQEIATHAFKNFVFLVDGLDEAKDQAAAKEIIKNLSAYGTVLVASRDYYYEKLSNPKDLLGEHERYNLLPLNRHQIGNIVNNSEDDKFLSETFQLKEFITNPLMLYLILQILPELRNIEKTNAITRYEIYRLFFHKLFQTRENSVRAQTGIRPSVNLQQAFDHYAKAKALAEWSDATISPSLDADTLQAERACIVSQHQTFVEYFIAKSIIEDIQNFYRSSPRYINQKFFGDNQSLLDFISEGLQSFPEDDYLNMIHNLISMMTASPKISASNAASILNKLSFPLSRLNLSGLNVSANFDGAICDHTRLSNAILEGSTFNNAYFNKTICQGTDLRETSFGKMPVHTFSREVSAFCLLQDNEHYAAATQNKIDIYRLKDQSLVDSWNILSTQKISAICFNKDRTLLLYLTDTGVVILRDKIKTILSPSCNNNPVKNIKFSDDSNSIICITERKLYKYNIRSFISEEHDINFLHYECAGHPALDKSNQRMAFSVRENYETHKFVVKDISANVVLTEYNCETNIEGIKFDAEKNYLYLILKDRTCCIFDITQKKIIYTIKALDLSADFDVTANGSCLAYVCHNYDDPYHDYGTTPIILNSVLYFYDLSKLRYTNTNKKLKNVTSYLHPTLPLFIQKLSDNILSVISLTQKSDLFQVKTTNRIAAFSCFLDNLYILSDQLSIYLLKTGKCIKTILIDKFFDQTDPRTKFHFKSEYEFMLYTWDQIWMYPSQKIYNVPSDERRFISGVTHDETNTAYCVIGYERHSDVPGEAHWDESIQDYDYTPDVVKVELCVDLWDSESGRTTSLISTLSGHFEPGDSAALYPAQFYEIKTNYIFSHAGAVSFYNKNNFLLSQEFGLGGYPRDAVFIPEKNCVAACYENNIIKIFSLETHSKIAEFTQEGLYEQDEHHGVTKLEWNSALNLLYSDAPSGIALWHLDFRPNHVEVTLLYDPRHMLDVYNLIISPETIIDEKTKSLLKLEKIPNKEESNKKILLKGQTRYQRNSELSLLEKLPDELLLHIMGSLSYKDRLMLSCASILLRIISNNELLNNTYGELLTTADINNLTPSIKSYFNQFFINNFHATPKEESVTIKPHKQGADLVTIGLFAGDKQREFTVQIKQLTSAPFNFT